MMMDDNIPLTIKDENIQLTINDENIALTNTIQKTLSSEVYESNYKRKLTMINQLLDDVKKRKKKHYSLFGFYKNINMLTKTFINTCNAISLCSIVLTLTPTSIYIMSIALAATTLSSVSTAVHTSLNIEEKVHLHQTSSLQYTDLYRDINARILKNGLRSQDLDFILQEMNGKLGLIEDHSLPIHM